MAEELDTSDIDRWVGVPLSQSGLVEPIQLNDIRRWAQAMHHPNPLYYNPEYAAASRFGQIVAPQSFTVVCEAGHGARPSTQGHIPESHMLFAGDEWWFFGPRIFPGDRVTIDQMVFDYRKTTTKFAGPTVVQRGDNHYVNQRGERIAIQRSSAIRYQPATARASAAFDERDEEIDWSDDDLARITKEKHEYVSSIIALGHDRRSWDSVQVGDELPAKVIGPHSVVSFTTEWRAYSMTGWNTAWRKQLADPGNSGWTAEMSVNEEHAGWDPEFADGAYYGAARGHLNAKYAKRIGMPRPYGYGASMGAWVLDYLSSWAGEWGYVHHTNTQYRGPALSGDVTYLRATVTDKSPDVDPAMGKIHLDYVMTNQRGEVQAKGSGEVLIPRD
ncbi:acyl dehydratase [Acrocarpospora pleiomorpha]|uniref:Acyl dehydratase n=1 Tax=Acrocarpospora pleiomorpha TaxID=90975 RepID=A0A5M3XDY9_9ACTN|nr:MaoC family dehydratase N-terminal domain-containing protein [Acrocarpospora pleiomorpha]GES18389.1 acyl dehydratase [Acrocarpospora pleiomorpha]